jgi:hypothetical protein
MSRARDDEWTFVLLGRDTAATAAVRAWIKERIRQGKNHPDDPQIVEARQWIEAVEKEQSITQQKTLSHETQESIGRWAVESFGGEMGLTPRHCIRLLEEVMELCLAAGASLDEIDVAVVAQARKCCQRLNRSGRSPEPAKVPCEMADCAIVLDTLAHRAGIDLQAEKDAKMKINRSRKWKSMGDGTGYHIREDSDG